MSTPQTDPQTTPDAPQADAQTTPDAKAEEATCGFLVPQGTEDGGKKVSKPCVKKPGHDGPHTARVYSKVDTSVVSLDALNALEVVPTAEKVEGLTERVRDDLQKKVDGIVLTAHKLWTEAGKPSGFNEAIAKGAGQRFFIDPDQAPAYRSLLKRAAAFHTLEGTPMHVRIIPPKRHQDGRTMLYWIAIDKREQKADAKPEVKPAEESKPAEPQTDAPQTDVPQTDAPPTVSAEEAARHLARPRPPRK
jgi:hypothetical protein